MQMLSCISLVDNIDPHRHANSRAQHGPWELTVVRSGYYFLIVSGVTIAQLNLTPPDAQFMHFTQSVWTDERARRSEAGQLQECPASEQAG